MRLGQLARKVNVKPAQIVSFLGKEHNILVDDNLNSKIEDATLALVLEKFKVEKKNAAPKVKEELVITETIKEDITEEAPIEVKNSIEEEVALETVEDVEEKIELKEFYL